MAWSRLDEIVTDAANRWPGDLAVVDEARRVTYGQLAEGVERVAADLRARGLQPGDRVLVVAGNRARFVEAHFGVLRAGGVSVPLSPEARPAQIQSAIGDTGARVVISAGSDDGLHIDLTTEAPGPEGPGAELAVLLYTTGTSAMPKAVMLTHENTRAAVLNNIAFLRPDRERELITVPVSHSFGLGQLYTTLATGGTAYLASGLKRMRQVLEVMDREAITSFPTTPTGYQLLLDRGGRRFVESGHAFRLSVVNSSPLRPALAERIQSAFPAMRLVVYYGLTEASRSTFLDVSAESASACVSVGRPPAGVTVEVIDGEIAIQGPTVTAGYWNRPEETAAACRDGKFFTGDIGFFDHQGRLRLQGRRKELINVGGLKVSPAEVELVIQEHPAVADCAVCGLPDDLSDEQVAALVVPVDSRGVQPDDLSAFCASRLEMHQVPRTWRTASAIPRSETGKPIRDRVRELLLETPAPTSC